MNWHQNTQTVLMLTDASTNQQKAEVPVKSIGEMDIDVKAAFVGVQS